jgi:lysophospholipase L1-like esterase
MDTFARPEGKAPAITNTRHAGDDDLQANDAAGLPRVLLIGDSICQGYAAAVRDRLTDKANVYSIPENGGPTSNGLVRLSQWLSSNRWDVIHFNWGLHDLKVRKDGTREISVEAYGANLQELVRALQTTGATLIWATTTPVPADDAKLLVKRKSADVPVYNAIARRIMDANHITVDDLYTFALPQLSQIQIPMNVHYTPEGYRTLATNVAAVIERALPKRQPSRSGAL